MFGVSGDMVKKFNPIKETALGVENLNTDRNYPKQLTYHKSNHSELMKINQKYLENRYKYYCNSCKALVSEKVTRIGDYGMCNKCLDKKTNN